MHRPYLFIQLIQTFIYTHTTVTLEALQTFPTYLIHTHNFCIVECLLLKFTVQISAMSIYSFIISENKPKSED